MRPVLFCLFCALLTLSLAHAQVAETPPDEVLCPRLAQPPTLDGDLSDPCWQGAPPIANFGLVGKFTPAAKPVTMRCGFDDQWLYLAFTCAEPQPTKLRTLARDGMRSVWRDDCLEIFLRVGDSVLDGDQFIVNAAGARQAERMRTGRYVPDYALDWRAAAARGATQWTAEVALPLAALDLSKPPPGQMVQLAVGREDQTGGQSLLTNWPLGAAYGISGGYGRLYFATASPVLNPAMSEVKDGVPVAWGFGDQGKDAQCFGSVEDAGRSALVFRTPDRYCVAQQGLKLRPATWYRLEAWVKGTARVNLRARTSARKGDPSTPYDVTSRVGDEYARYEVRFPSGETGDALLILGSNPGLGKGEVRIAGLRVVQDLNLEADGPAIPLAADKPTVLTKALVTDCRAVRGFITSPVDGRLKSYDWDVNVWEYGMAGAGAGVGYDYRQNDGLHVTLADKQGVDAVQIRRGAAVKLYAGADRYDSPGQAPLVWTFKGLADSARALFPKRILSDRFSFFDRTDGLIADVSFLRVGDRLRGKPGPAYTLDGPGAWGDLQPVVEERFPEKQRMVAALVPEKTGETGPCNLSVESRQSLHLLTPPLAEETSLDAVSVKLQLAGTPTGCPLTVALQDPLEPRAELMGVDVVLQGATAKPVLDFPDQVIPAGKPLWLTLTFGAPVTIEKLQVGLVTLPRAAAVPQALAYRTLQMRGLFSQLSEARQWTTLRKTTDLAKFYRESQYGPAILQLHNALATCKALGPDDDLVRCYDEWLWRTARDLPPFTPKLDTAPGAPEWAALAHQLWLLNRQVAQWWLDNRLVPTGEFGGLVGDDSDLYQNFADFPIYESDGVAARIKAGADDLAELAEQTTLEGGLNKHTMDPLHAYEEGMNHEALLLWWHYGDPVYFERCLLAAKNLPALTTVTAQGHRHFKNQSCGAEDLRIDRPLELDGGAHPLMWHPALEVAWYSHSSRVLKYLDEWAGGWLAHMKPGEYATMVDVRTETVTEKTSRPLYGGYGGQGTAHNFLYWITADPKYLQPYADGFARGEAIWPSNEYLPELWQRGFMDPYQDKPGWVSRHPLVQALTGGDRQPLYDMLKNGIAELQRFGPIYTTAEVFTDRVFLDNLKLATMVYCGGFATRNKYNQSHAVSWSGFGTDYAAFVLLAHRDRLKVLVYNFRDKPQTGTVRFWTLDHGQYRVTLGPDANGDDAADKLTRDETREIGRATALPLTLPPRQVVVLELTQTAKLDDLRLRPDLALSAFETRVDNAITGVVHNIGGGPAPATTVVLLTPGGEVTQTARISPLAAPDDLQPKRAAFRFSLPRPSTRGWRVVVDPDNLVPELYEGNNAVTLGP